MQEYTFILLKPDAMQNKEIYNFIYKEIQKESLYFYEKKEVIITEYMVENIWKFLNKDTVGKLLMLKYLLGKSVELWLLRGDDAIQKINRLKQKVRKQFAKSMISNCFHAPRTYKEYKADLECICNSDHMKQNIVNKIDELDRKTADILWEFLKEPRFEKNYQTIRSIHGVYYLMLENDDKHTVAEMVNILLEVFKTWNSIIAYYVCFATDNIGEWPISFNVSLDKIEKIKEMLENKGVNTRILLN